MSPAEPDPLLTPTLTEVDDTAGFDRPWNPWTLVAFTFFFGLVGGGCLLAVNYQKLGIRGRLDGAVVGSTLVGIVVSTSVYWVLIGGMVAVHDWGTRAIVRAASRSLSTLCAIYLASTQQKRWRLFRATGLPRGKLLGTAIQAAVGSLMLQYILGKALLQIAAAQ